MIDIQTIPDALKEGESWPLLDIDPDWLWLARDAEGRIVGFLLAAPCHGLAFIWRIRMLPSAPSTALLKMLRAFIRDIRRRGCIGYLALLDVCTRVEEQALARIAFRAGANFAMASTLVIGSVNAKHVREG